MQYIVIEKENSMQAFIPYRKRRLGEKGTVIELSDEQVKWAKQMVERIEYDFEMEIGKLDWTDLGILAQQSVMIVTVGKEPIGKDIQYAFEISEQKWQPYSNRRNSAIWIHAYTKQEGTKVSRYLSALDQMYQLSKLLNVPLIIIGQFRSLLPYYQKDSLAREIAEAYLENNDVLMICQDFNEPFQNISGNLLKKGSKHILHIGGSNEHMQKWANLWLTSLAGESQQSKTKQQVIPLYEDPFYQQIPLEQKIYLPINEWGNELNDLNMGEIAMNRHQKLLYGKRRCFDEKRASLKEFIFSYLEMPIMTRIPIHKRNLKADEIPIKKEEQLPYTGKGVYIGILTEEGVDYTHDGLRTEVGGTRIAHYWVQEEADYGQHFSKQEIDRSLSKNSTLHKRISLNRDFLNRNLKEETQATILLMLAGGQRCQNELRASQSEFLVAQIQPAPKVLQGIYGGDTEQSAVLMADVIIAVRKLICQAREDKKPLILILPYQMNLSPHDGRGFYEKALNELIYGSQCMLIVPAGEEGKQKHHQTVWRPQSTSAGHVRLYAAKKATCLVGILTFNHFGSVPSQFPIELLDCQIPFRKVPLTEKGCYTIGDSQVETTGVCYRREGNTAFIQFRIRQMTQGVWQIENLPMSNYQNASIDIWIGEKALNPSVTIESADAFRTLNACGLIENGLMVGHYNQMSESVQGASGRGAKEGEAGQLFCIVEGKAIGRNGDGQWYEVEGTSISASLLVNAVAILYEKEWSMHPEELGQIACLKGKLYPYLETTQGVVYPHFSQGYGILNLKKLSHLLRIEH